MGAKTKEKDQSMAHNMKARGEERTNGRCCICYQIVTIGPPPNGSILGHLMKCKGPTRKGSRMRALKNPLPYSY